jgi:hypothetical protein
MQKLEACLKCQCGVLGDLSCWSKALDNEGTCERRRVYGVSSILIHVILLCTVKLDARGE